MAAPAAALETLLQQWCGQEQLPQIVLEHLESEGVLNPNDLCTLDSQDIQELCKGMKFGHKARLKAAIEALR